MFCNAAQYPAVTQYRVDSIETEEVYWSISLIQKLVLWLHTKIETISINEKVQQKATHKNWILLRARARTHTHTHTHSHTHTALWDNLSPLPPHLPYSPTKSSQALTHSLTLSRATSSYLELKGALTKTGNAKDNAPFLFLFLDS